MNAKEARAQATPIREKKHYELRKELISVINRSIGFAVKSGQLESKIHLKRAVNGFDFSQQVIHEITSHFRDLGYVVDISYDFEDENEQRLSASSFIKLSW